MKNGILFLSSFFIISSADLCAVEGPKSQGELKRSKSAEKLDLSCYNCSKYVLTMKNSLPKNHILFWEYIVKPSHLTVGSDASSLIPVTSLPAISCPECKKVCCEPTWHAQGDKLKAAYKVITKDQTK